MADDLLFNISSDELLISVYQKQGRTLDDLPYTQEFERIYEALVGDDTERAVGDATAMTRADLFHRLHNLRKAGKLPKLGRATGERPHIDAEQETLLARIVEQRIERLSLRDQLVYTDAFDQIAAQFNAEAGLNLSPHDVWRIVAKLAK